MPDFDYHEDQMAVESQVDDIRERIDRIPAPKGQLISKENCQTMNSSKKGTNEFVSTTMRHVFVCFLEEIEDSKKTFRN